jgi:Asparagine synthase
MYFTLAVSADDAARCDALTREACSTDPRIMPIPGPPGVAWRAADGRAAIVRWPGGAGPDGRSHAGTIWAQTAGDAAAVICGRTSITRVDPVYTAVGAGAVVLSDRASWAAAVTGRLGDTDSDLLCALLNPGYPLGGTTPFAGVRAVSGAASVRATSGVMSRSAVRPVIPEGGGAKAVATALIAAVEPLRSVTGGAAAEPVELSLTGGKDSRIVAAALVAAGVPVHAHTHGFADHPDVVVAREIAGRLGIDYTVRVPVAPGQQVDPLGRIRSAVLVADGMLSAFENTGGPDPRLSATVTAGGHGGELLRGGYAEVPAGGLARRTAGSVELLRRLTSRRIRLLRRGPAARYLAGLAPWVAAQRRGPLHVLDDFYLVNRAGRWSAAARQGYLIRENIVQPLFDDRVVRAARSVPLNERTSGRLSRAVLAELSPALTDVPLAGKGRSAFDWRRNYGDEVAGFLREYVLDLGTTGGLFDVVSRPAAEHLLRPPHADPSTVWALATLACLVSGDWRNAREPSGRTFRVGPVPGS